MSYPKNNQKTNLAKIVACITILFLITSCGKFRQPTKVIVKKTDDIHKAIKAAVKNIDNIDDVVRLSNNITIIKNPNASLLAEINRIPTPDDGTIIVNNPRNIIKIGNKTLAIIDSNKTVIIGNIDERDYQQLEILLNSDSLSILQNTVSLDNLDSVRRNKIQLAANKAAERAVGQALSKDVNAQSLEALSKDVNDRSLQAAKMAARTAVIKEIGKYSGIIGIIFVSEHTINKIVNQSVTQALQQEIEENDKENFHR